MLVPMIVCMFWQQIDTNTLKHALRKALMFCVFFFLFITETPPLGCDRGGDPPHYFATAEVGPVEVYIPFMRCMGTLLMDRNSVGRGPKVL
jgi:hypothetical protein